MIYDYINSSPRMRPTMSIAGIEGAFRGGAEGYASRSFLPVQRLMGNSVRRGLLAGGMGVLALGQTGNMMQRLRYRDYYGAAMSGAMAAGAGYGAYMTLMHRKAMTEHLQSAANMVAKNARGGRSVGNFIRAAIH